MERDVANFVGYSKTCSTVISNQRVINVFAYAYYPRIRIRMGLVITNLIARNYVVNNSRSRKIEFQKSNQINTRLIEVECIPDQRRRFSNLDALKWRNSNATGIVAYF